MKILSKVIRMVKNNLHIIISIYYLCIMKSK